MDSSVLYSKTDDQINKMKSQGLIVSDVSSTKQRLQTYGYSSIVKSYRDPYVYIDESGKKKYRENVSFDQIYSLYVMDKNLRAGIFTAMLEMEEYIKNNASEIISKDFGTEPDKYLNYRNYRDKARNKKFSLAKIIGDLKSTLNNSGKDPIKHYRDKYGIVPPWILFKGVYFSTIVNFVRDFKTAQLDQMAEKMYTIDNTFTLEDAKSLLIDTMFICNEYRNLCAHGGRTYNFENEATCRMFPNDTGIVLLLNILRKLKNPAPFMIVNQSLTNVVNRHCSSFPQDVTYLGQILHMNIQLKEYAWISEKTKKIHRIPHCSGLQDAVQVEYTPDLLKQYRKCKRCIKE